MGLDREKQSVVYLIQLEKFSEGLFRIWVHILSWMDFVDPRHRRD